MEVIYDKTQNPLGDTLPGVPLDNMSAEQYRALPTWLQVSVAACPFYSVPNELKPALDVEPGTEMEPPKPAEDEVNNQ